MNTRVFIWGFAPDLKGNLCDSALKSPTIYNQQQTNHERKQAMKNTLAETIKGMEVKSWERREHSDGKCVVYVRFVPKAPAVTVEVKSGE